MVTNVYVEPLPYSTLPDPFLNRISSIMVSRLMLNIRDPKLYVDGYYGASTINGRELYGQGGRWYGVHGAVTLLGDDSGVMISNSLRIPTTIRGREA